jgi:thiol-disulfide isomerase/thioredoxin
LCGEETPHVNPQLVPGGRKIDLRRERGEHDAMALTESSSLGPAFAMPDFFLPDVSSGESVSAPAVTGEKGTVIVFLCRHCPYVVHIFPTLLALARDYLPRSIGFAGISANNAATHPEDAPARLAAMVKERDIPFPVLYDETQETARAFRAQCTPEFYLFDPAARLYYHGRMDSSTPGNNVPCTGSDLRAALDALLAGRPAPHPQHASMGCNIKWK